MKYFLVNMYPPWDSYRDLIMVKIISLNNHPGFRPAVLGDVVHHLISKTMLEVYREDSTRACGKDKQYKGLPPGVEGVIHDMCLV